MEFSCKYNANNVYKAFEDLKTIERKRAIKGGLRKAGRKLKKYATDALISSGLKIDKRSFKWIRVVVYKDKIGVRLTIGTKKDTATRKGYGFHKNRAGQLKPVLIWAEGGTNQRRTKDRKTLSFFTHKRGHSTGRMKSYDFMKAAQTHIPEVAENVSDDIVNEITRIANKNKMK